MFAELEVGINVLIQELTNDFKQGHYACSLFLNPLRISFLEETVLKNLGGWPTVVTTYRVRC